MYDLKDRDELISPYAGTIVPDPVHGHKLCTIIEYIVEFILLPMVVAAGFDSPSPIPNSGI